jgi:putative aldouronate transport system permease protein
MESVQIKRNKRPAFLKYWPLYLMIALPLAYFIIFKYVPMFGAILAFRRFRIGKPFGTDWMGLAYFEIFLKNPLYWRAFRNTITLSLLNLIINFPGPIIFAILINELRFKKFKKFVQTVSYMPRFMSTVVIISIMATMLMPNSGVVNKLMGTNIDFIGRPENFKWIYVFTDMWQWTGFTAIIYLAAITGIDTDLYEAARIDGANRFKQTWHVTIPGILPTVMVMLILNLGRLLSVGIEKSMLLYRPSNSSASDVIDYFVYRYAFVGTTNYSLAAAAGLFGAIISTVLVISSNTISRKVTGSGIY